MLEKLLALLSVSALGAGAAVINIDGFLVSDNLLGGASDASYSEPGLMGGQDTGQPDSWNGDRRWGNDGAGTQSTWLFSGLPSGEYNVYASWRNVPQANVSLARYTGTDGLAPVELDQRIGAAALPGVVINDGSNDINFALVGTVSVADGDFALSVDDSVTGSADSTTFIFADAVALSVVPEPASLGLVLIGLLPILRRRR